MFTYIYNNRWHFQPYTKIIISTILIDIYYYYYYYYIYKRVDLKIITVLLKPEYNEFIKRELASRKRSVEQKSSRKK